jgi:hypothetical protein
MKEATVEEAVSSDHVALVSHPDLLSFVSSHFRRQSRMEQRAGPLSVNSLARQKLATEARHSSVGSENSFKEIFSRQSVMPGFADEVVRSLNQRIRVAVRNRQATLRLGACKLIPAAG